MKSPEASRRREAVPDLDVVEVLQQLIVQQRQAVAHPEVVLGEAHAHLRIHPITRHGELGAADLLPAEQVADGRDGLELVVEVGLQVEHHERPPPSSAELHPLLVSTSTAMPIWRAVN